MSGTIGGPANCEFHKCYLVSSIRREYCSRNSLKNEQSMSDDVVHQWKFKNWQTNIHNNICLPSATVTQQLLAQFKWDMFDYLALTLT